jgi:hypothetical protein
MSLVDKLKEIFEPQDKEQAEAMQKIQDRRFETFGKLAISIADKLQSSPIQRLLNERKMLNEIIAHTDVLIKAQAEQNSLTFWTANKSQ